MTGQDHGPDRSGGLHDQTGLGSIGASGSKSKSAPRPGPNRRSPAVGRLREPLGGDPGSRLWLFFGFDGRIGRASYWLGTLILYAAILVGFIAIGMLEAIGHAVIGPMGVWIVGIPVAAVAFGVVLVASFALPCKRWHDRDKSGWWILIGAVPILGPLWILIEVGLLPGTPGPNRFGHASVPVFSP